MALMVVLVGQDSRQFPVGYLVQQPGTHDDPWLQQADTEREESRLICADDLLKRDSESLADLPKQWRVRHSLAAALIPETLGAPEGKPQGK